MHPHNPYETTERVLPQETQDVTDAALILGNFTGVPVEGVPSFMKQQATLGLPASGIPEDHDCTRCSIQAASCTLLNLAQKDGGNNPFAHRLEAVRQLTKEDPSFLNNANAHDRIKERIASLSAQSKNRVTEVFSQLESATGSTPITTENTAVKKSNTTKDTTVLQEIPIASHESPAQPKVVVEASNPTNEPKETQSTASTGHDEKVPRHMAEITEEPQTPSVLEDTVTFESSQASEISDEKVAVATTNQQDVAIRKSTVPPYEEKDHVVAEVVTQWTTEHMRTVQEQQKNEYQKIKRQDSDPPPETHKGQPEKSSVQLFKAEYSPSIAPPLPDNAFEEPTVDELSFDLEAEKKEKTTITAEISGSIFAAQELQKNAESPEPLVIRLIGEKEEQPDILYTTHDTVEDHSIQSEIPSQNTEDSPFGQSHREQIVDIHEHDATITLFSQDDLLGDDQDDSILDLSESSAPSELNGIIETEVDDEESPNPQESAVMDRSAHLKQEQDHQEEAIQRNITLTSLVEVDLSEYFTDDISSEGDTFQPDNIHAQSEEGIPRGELYEEDTQPFPNSVEARAEETDDHGRNKTNPQEVPILNSINSNADVVQGEIEQSNETSECIDVPPAQVLEMFEMIDDGSKDILTALETKLPDFEEPTIMMVFVESDEYQEDFQEAQDDTESNNNPESCSVRILAISLEKMLDLCETIGEIQELLSELSVDENEDFDGYFDDLFEEQSEVSSEELRNDNAGQYDDKIILLWYILQLLTILGQVMLVISPEMLKGHLSKYPSHNTESQKTQDQEDCRDT